MILLHHPESALSRNIHATKGEGVEVVNWTSSQHRQDYKNRALPEPSAFPSVVVDAPAYTAQVPQVNENGEFLGVVNVTIPTGPEILRLPASWDAVDSFTAFVEARALANPPVE